nr:putative ribonuclease H-like domain-containing protein [Tanacetum cinerariifolium]
MNDFYAMKGIRREFSVARTLQQNGVAERRNRTLIEAARTMLADSKSFSKFDGKADEGFFFGYSMNSKDFKVYNIRTRRVEENLHIEFLENKTIVVGDGPEWLFGIDILTKSMNYVPVVAGDGPEWLFGIDILTKSMNYVPVVAGTNSNDFAGTQDSIGAGQSNIHNGSTQDYIFMPLWKDGSPLFDFSPKISNDDGSPPSGDAGKKHDEVSNKEKEEADFTNLESSIHVTPTPTTRIHKNYPFKQVIRSLNTPVQTRSKLKPTNEQGFINAVYERKTHKDLNTCLFACFLSQIEPKRVSKALFNPAWVEAMQEELLEFKLQTVWILVDFPKGKKAISKKWVFKNKEDERGIVIKNKSKLVAHGYTQEEGIDYNEVFAPVARIEVVLSLCFIYGIYGVSNRCEECFSLCKD